MRPALRALLFFGVSQVERVINGGFDTDTNWSKGTGWTISGGKATKEVGSASNLGQDIAGSLGDTNWFELKFDVLDRTAGLVTPFLAGASMGSISVNGSRLYRAKAGSATYEIAFSASATFDGSIDNVSIRALP